MGMEETESYLDFDPAGGGLMSQVYSISLGSSLQRIILQGGLSRIRYSALSSNINNLIPHGYWWKLDVIVTENGGAPYTPVTKYGVLHTTNYSYINTGASENMMTWWTNPGDFDVDVRVRFKAKTGVNQVKVQLAVNMDFYSGSHLVDSGGFWNGEVYQQYLTSS